MLLADGGGTLSTVLWWFVGLLFLWMIGVGFAYWRAELRRGRRTREANTRGPSVTNWPVLPSRVSVERTTEPNP